MSQATVVKTTAISGFDPDGEPEIREMSDGTLMVLFNFMPPSYAEDDESKYADFEKQIEEAIGVPVFREDRERFLIRDPQSDTAEKLKAFLEGYRKATDACAPDTAKVVQRVNRWILLEGSS